MPPPGVEKSFSIEDQKITKKQMKRKIIKKNKDGTNHKRTNKLFGYQPVSKQLPTRLSQDYHFFTEPFSSFSLFGSRYVEGRSPNLPTMICT